MPIELTKGDLFATPGLGALISGVDGGGEMAGGVAGQFKKRWPAMYDEYAALCAGGRLALGDVFPWVGSDVTIYNLVIQRNWRDKAKHPALATALDKALALASKAGIQRIGLPRIGTGLGGLDWVRVQRTLEEAAAKTDITLVVFTQFVRDKGTATPPA